MRVLVTGGWRSCYKRRLSLCEGDVTCWPEVCRPQRKSGSSGAKVTRRRNFRIRRMLFLDDLIRQHVNSVECENRPPDQQTLLGSVKTTEHT